MHRKSADSVWTVDVISRYRKSGVVKLPFLTLLLWPINLYCVPLFLFGLILCLHLYSDKDHNGICRCTHEWFVDKDLGFEICCPLKCHLDPTLVSWEYGILNGFEACVHVADYDLKFSQFYVSVLRFTIKKTFDWKAKMIHQVWYWKCLGKYFVFVCVACTIKDLIDHSFDWPQLMVTSIIKHVDS